MSAELKLVVVTMNYNGNMQKKLNVPASWDNKKIDAALKKKYGIYDILKWVVEGNG